MSVTINGSTGVTTPGISNSEGYTGDGLTVAAGAPAGAVTVDSSGNVGIGASSPQRKLDVTVNDTSTAQLYLRNNNASYASGLITYNAGGEASVFRHNGSSDASYAGANSLNIGTVTNDVVAIIQNNTERMRLDSSGNLLVGTTSTSVTAVGARMLASNQIQASKSGDWSFRMGRRDSTGIITEIYYNDSRVGDIATNGSTTSYNTSSDYRLKENIAPMQGALATVAQLNPVTYNWKADGSAGQGFIAHELQAVVPDCVTGEKDAVDAEGKPQYQGVDTSFLVATLTAAIQELKAELDAVKAELVALKGAA